MSSLSNVLVPRRPAKAAPRPEPSSCVSRHQEEVAGGRRTAKAPGKGNGTCQSGRGEKPGCFGSSEERDAAGVGGGGGSDGPRAGGDREAGARLRRNRQAWRVPGVGTRKELCRGSVAPLVPHGGYREGTVFTAQEGDVNRGRANGKRGAKLNVFKSEINGACETTGWRRTRESEAVRTRP